MNINLTTPLNALGYGVVGWNVLRALEKRGVETALWTIGNIEALHQTLEEKTLFQTCRDRRVMFNQYAPSLRIYHQFDMAQHVGKGLRCGLTFFELNKFFNYERHHLGYLDRILLPSHWAADVVVEEIPHCADNVRVVPMGVDREIFDHKAVGDSPVDTETVFLNMGKWEIRKGHDVLVEAFNAAFEPSDNVRLVMACENPLLKPEQNAEWQREYKESKLGDKVTLLNRVETHREVAQIMAKAHCGVFPSRGEGWNMEALEMLSMGKHLIITDYSAQADFCDQFNSRIIPVQSVEPAYDGIWFHGRQTDRGVVPSWGHIGDAQMEALVLHMRDVHAERERGELEINQKGIETAERFSWDRTAYKILDALDLTPQE